MADVSLSKTASFLDNSLLDTVVTESSESELAAIISSEHGEQTSQDQGLVAVEHQRPTLFLDEVATVYIVLKTPFVGEETFKAHLARFDVSLDTYAVGTTRGQHDENGAQPAPIKDAIDSHKVEDLEDPMIALGEGDPEEPKSKSIYVLWKTEVHVDRTKIRSLNPSLFFAASISLRSDSILRAKQEDEYMQPGVPQPADLLEAFQYDPNFRDDPPRLLASRLSKMIPAGSLADDSSRLVKHSSRRLVRLASALNNRVRFCRVGASPTQAKVLFSLETEVSSFVKHSIRLDRLEITMTDGKVEPLWTENVLRLPRDCKPHDVLSFVYDLLPNNDSIHRDIAGKPSTSIHNLSIAILATVHHSESEIPLKTRWRTAVDLTTLNQRPLFTLAPQPSDTFSNGRHRSSNALSTSNLSNYLVTMTISGPDIVHVGATLHWHVLLANRSPTRTLRLALVPITYGASRSNYSSTMPTSNAKPTANRPNTLKQPTSATLERPQSQHRHSAQTPPRPHSQSQSRPLPQLPTQPPQAQGHNRTSSSILRPSTAGSTSEVSRPQSHPTTSAAPTQPQLQSTPVAPQPAPALIPLTPDVRTGPLTPGSSTTAELKFMVLQEGVLHVECLRIVDLDAGEEEEGAESEKPDDGKREVEEESKGRVSVEGRRTRGFVDLRGPMLPDIVAVEAAAEGNENDNEDEED